MPIGAHDAEIKLHNLPEGQVCIYNLNLKNQEQGQMIKLWMEATSGYSYGLFYNNLVTNEQMEVGQ